MLGVISESFIEEMASELAFAEFQWVGKRRAFHRKEENGEKWGRKGKACLENSKKYNLAGT